ncbi:hypothetical protein BOX15_Mlig024932g1 [Macrostomum lignano]|uniref:PEHE domain-containing protein n=2 Tax=Macrostomum lignano TaxID=282301 RepID=A0A1I8G7X0_9PLAT|nr:hypothetical protein BOX15_Mlig024932g1 [Macrostomum lignano]
MRKSAAATAVDDPLRIRDMKVPASVYNTSRRLVASSGDSAASGSTQKLQLTLGRVTGGSGSRGAQLRRRRTALTGDADVGRRLRSLSAEERRIMERIQQGDSAGRADSGGDGGESIAYQDLCKNVRLTFTGNQAISCSKLAANQARTMRLLETAKRPPQPQPLPRRVGGESSRLRGSARSAVMSGPTARGRSRGGGRLSSGYPHSTSLSRRNRTAGKQSQPKHEQRNQQLHSQQQSMYTSDVSVVKELNSSSASDYGDGVVSGPGSGVGGSGRARDSSDGHDYSMTSPGCSPSTIRQLERRLSALDLRGANPQTAEAVASLNSWVCAGASLLRHISAAREAAAPRQLQLQKQQREQQIRQLNAELETRQRLEDGWDPAEINVGRLIRRRHLDALLSNSAGGSASEDAVAGGADGDVQFYNRGQEDDLFE